MKTIKVLGVLGLTIAGLALTAWQVSAVPVYNPLTGHWYEIVSSGTDGSWASAEANAVALGGHLVTVNDIVEQAWLQAQFGDVRYWIGYTDQATEGTWVWASGETPGFTYWASGEPNDSMPPPYGEDYAVINWNTDGTWNDWDNLRPDYSYIRGIAEYSRAPDAASTALLLGLSSLALAAYKRRR